MELHTLEVRNRSSVHRCTRRAHVVGFEEGDFLHPDGVEESEESLCSNYSDNYIFDICASLYTIVYSFSCNIVYSCQFWILVQIE